MTGHKSTDLLAVEDIAEEFGWDTKRAWTLLRSLGRQGLVVKFQGHRRLYVRRGDMESAMSMSEPSEDDYASSGGVK